MLLKGRPPQWFTWEMIRVEYATEHKYLGIILDDRLTFRPHLDYIARKAVDIFYKINRIGRATRD